MDKRTSDWLMVALTTIKFKFKFMFIYSHLFNYNTSTIRKKKKQKLSELYIELNITKEKVCSRQRSLAFELATTTEWLQVGGGYTVLIKNCLN